MTGKFEGFANTQHRFSQACTFSEVPFAVCLRAVLHSVVSAVKHQPEAV